MIQWILLREKHRGKPRHLSMGKYRWDFLPKILGTPGPGPRKPWTKCGLAQICIILSPWCLDVWEDLRDDQIMTHDGSVCMVDWCGSITGVILLMVAMWHHMNIFHTYGSVMGSVMSLWWFLWFLLTHWGWSQPTMDEIWWIWASSRSLEWLSTAGNPDNPLASNYLSVFR